MKVGESLEGFGWGAGLLLLLIAAYAVALTQFVPPSGTGVRVIPWQAPDLEISSPTAEIQPPES